MEGYLYLEAGITNMNTWEIIALDHPLWRSVVKLTTETLKVNRRNYQGILMEQRKEPQSNSHKQRCVGDCSDHDRGLVQSTNLPTTIRMDDPLQPRRIATTDKYETC